MMIQDVERMLTIATVASDYGDPQFLECPIPRVISPLHAKETEAKSTCIPASDRASEGGIF